MHKAFVFNFIFWMFYCIATVNAQSFVYVDSTSYQILGKKNPIDSSLVFLDKLKEKVLNHYITYDIGSHHDIWGYDVELLENKFKFDLEKYFYWQLSWSMKLDDYFFYFYEWYERDYLFVMILSSNKLFLSFYSNTDRFNFYKTVQHTGKNSLSQWILDSNYIISMKDSYDGLYFKQIIDYEKQKERKPLIQKYTTINKIIYNVYRLIEPKDSPTEAVVTYFSKAGVELKYNMKDKKHEFYEWQINSIVDSLSNIERNYKPLTSIFYIKWYGVILLAYDYKNDKVIKYFVPTLDRPAYNIW